MELYLHSPTWKAQGQLYCYKSTTNTNTTATNTNTNTPPLLLLLLFCTLLYLLVLHLAETTSRICKVLTFLKVNSTSIIMCSYVCDVCHTKCHTANSCGSLVITTKMKATENFWADIILLFKILEERTFQKHHHA